MNIDVKICGINSPESLDAAISGGASMVGFVFFPPSPRAITPYEAKGLMSKVPAHIQKVALMVDPDDMDVGAVCRLLPVDLLQLHGQESLKRVADISAITGKPIMKAVGVSCAADIAKAHSYESICARILLDAKAPKDAKLPGGNALAFDWTLISGETWVKPWMLAGGLTAQNLAEAVRVSGAGAVDTSSGVEQAPGQKSVEKIHEFLKLAQSL